MNMLIRPEPAVPAAHGITGADLARLRHSLDSSVSDNTRKRVQLRLEIL